jgi:predicted kinase
MPKCTILVGVPGSGKSTWLENQEHPDDTWIASTDYIIEEIALAYGMTYSEGFKDLIGFAEKAMWHNLKMFAEDGDYIYVDRTNMTKWSRKRFIEFLKPYGYEFDCVVFPTPEPEEWQRRLDSRPGKSIPQEAIDRMVNGYDVPTEDEGFTNITFL